MKLSLCFLNGRKLISVALLLILILVILKLQDQIILDSEFHF